MEAYLLLPLLILLSVLAALVFYQNSRAIPNRLFALLIGSAVLLTASGLIRLTTQDEILGYVTGALVVPLVGLSSVLLAPLVLAVFLPQRYAQPLVVWLITLPYLLATAYTVLDALLGWQAVYIGVTLDARGQFDLDLGPQRNWLLIDFILGQVVIGIMLATIAVRHRQWRAPAGTLFLGVVLSLVIGGSPAARSSPIVTYLSSIPLYLAFAWVTLRYGLFRPSSVVLEAAIDSLPDSVLILDQEQRVQYANRAAAELLGFSLAHTATSLPVLLERNELTPDQRQTDAATGRDYLVRAADRGLILEVTRQELSGDPRAARILVLRDVTAAERQATALAEQNEEQRRLLGLVASLETPVISLNDSILFVPVVGHLDERRNQALMTRLLEAVHRRRGRLIVIDIAGVPMIDTAVAAALNRTVRALRLLGCEVMLSGISAAIAITLTQVGGTLEDVRIIRSLQQAFDYHERLQH